MVDLKLLVDGLRPPIGTDEPFLTCSKGIVFDPSSLTHVNDAHESHYGGFGPSWIGRTPGYSLTDEMLDQIDSLASRVGTA